MTEESEESEEKIWNWTADALKERGITLCNLQVVQDNSLAFKLFEHGACPCSHILSLKELAEGRRWR